VVVVEREVKQIHASVRRLNERDTATNETLKRLKGRELTAHERVRTLRDERDASEDADDTVRGDIDGVEAAITVKRTRMTSRDDVRMVLAAEVRSFSDDTAKLRRECVDIDGIAQVRSASVAM
jgi:hypothetical protein